MGAHASTRVGVAPLLPKEELMARKNLTDRLLQSLKPAQPGSRYIVMDSVVPGLGVRVTPKGRITFVLVARFPPKTTSSRRELGRYNAMSLEKARSRAREWIETIQRGVDPKVEARELQIEKKAAAKNTFGAVVQDYLDGYAIGLDRANPLKRTGLEIERALRFEFLNDRKLPDGTFVKGLRDLPIADVKPKHISEMVAHTIARGSRGGARNYLGIVKAFFNWAIAMGKYGLETSPCDRMKPKAIFGVEHKRTRLHSERELLAIWRAAHRLGYPYGPFFHFLIISGKRKAEPTGAKWSEFDLKNREWIVPGERTKNKIPHLVYITDGMLSILKSLPRFRGPEAGPYLFSTTFGIKPINGFGKLKERLDRYAHEEYVKLLEEEGESSVGYDMDHYTIHDFRKDIRTKLSDKRLGVSRDVARLVIGHTIGGLDGVYDLYAYQEEKRHALEQWEAHLRAIGCLMDYAEPWEFGRTPSNRRRFFPKSG
jgi:integrase